MKKCVVSGKRKYHTKLACLLANAKRPAMARTYRCRACGFWHLTSHVPEALKRAGVAAPLATPSPPTYCPEDNLS